MIVKPLTVITWMARFSLAAVSGSIKIHRLPGSQLCSIKQLVPEADGLARGLSLKATGWVLAASQRGLRGGPASLLLAGQRGPGPAYSLGAG